MQISPPFARLSLQDASGSTAGVNAWLKSGTTALAGAGAAAQLAGAVAGLSGAVVTAYHVVFRGVEAPAPAPAGSNPVAGAGVFVYSCSGTDQYAIVVVPAIATSKLMATGAGAGILVDPTNADVIAFNETMLNSGFCSVFGHPIVALETAFLQWRP